MSIFHMYIARHLYLTIYAKFCRHDGIFTCAKVNNITLNIPVKTILLNFKLMYMDGYDFFTGVRNWYKLFADEKNWYEFLTDFMTKDKWSLLHICEEFVAILHIC